MRAVATLTVAALALALAGCSSAKPEPISTLPTEFGGSGTFVVGVDIAPGTYEQADPLATCEYGIQNEDGDTISLNGGAAILIASDGNTVTIENCGTYNSKPTD